MSDDEAIERLRQYLVETTARHRYQVTSRVFRNPSIDLVARLITCRQLELLHRTKMERRGASGKDFMAFAIAMTWATPNELSLAPL